MEVLLLVGIVALIGLVGYLLFQIKTLRQQVASLKEVERQSILLNKKELEFLEFTAEMYIKYAEDLNIHSANQHAYIVGELDRIRKEKLIPKIEQHAGNHN
jgi:Flp pilus assembly protein CpaB